MMVLSTVQRASAKERSGDTKKPRAGILATEGAAQIECRQRTMAAIAKEGGTTTMRAKAWALSQGVMKPVGVNCIGILKTVTHQTGETTSTTSTTAIYRR